MKFSRNAMLLFICLISISSLYSQNKNDQQPLKIKTNVIVLDSKEQFVEVKPEDLKILEDGVEQKVSKLSKKDSINVGIVIDNSGSLRYQFPAILGTANLIVENLRENDSAFAIRFVSRDKINIEQDWTSNKNLLKKGISEMFIEGGKSAVIDAVKLSADKLIEKKDESKRSALILISDCEDRDSYFKLEQALESVKDNEIEIYVIAFTKDLEETSKIPAHSLKQKAIGLAKTFAVESGGMAFFPKWSKKDQDELVAAARSIILELRSQYVVEYISTNPNAKDRERKIIIEAANALNGEKRFVFARSVIELAEK